MTIGKALLLLLLTLSGCTTMPAHPQAPTPSTSEEAGFTVYCAENPHRGTCP